MKEPERIPLDPSTPKSKKVPAEAIRSLKQLSLFDDIIFDNDNICAKTKTNENSQESIKT
jgi:hypothetical protein